MLGKRADTGVLMDKSVKCVVETIFHIENYHLEDLFAKYDLDFEKQTVIRREINPQGKSRAFINDTPVNLSTLKEFGQNLVDLHSQNQNLALSDSDFQVAIVDGFAGISQEVIHYKKLFLEYNALNKELKKLQEEEQNARSEKDYLHFLIDELNTLNPQPDEQEQLEKELEILNHADEIKTTLYNCNKVISSEETGLADQFNTLLSQLSKLSSYSTELEALHDRLNSLHIELSDILTESEKIEEMIELSPERLQEVTERLNQIYNLQNKHRVNSMTALLETKKNLEFKLTHIHSLEDRIGEISDELQNAGIELKKQATLISDKRQAIFNEMESRIVEILRSLGMPEASFEIEHTKLQEPGKDGIDTIDFLFSANKGIERQKLAKVASGGEKSRLMLAIKSLISKKNLLPTIIFDEIDTGVSGQVADKVANILKDLAFSMQVLAITHLPQIAGKGNYHYQVFKDMTEKSTTTRIKELEQEERLIEIAKLLSGQEVTEASIASAKHLLNN